MEELGNIKRQLGTIYKLASSKMVRIERERRERFVATGSGSDVSERLEQPGPDGADDKLHWCKKLDETQDSVSIIFSGESGVVCKIGKKIGEASFGMSLEGWW